MKINKISISLLGISLLLICGYLFLNLQGNIQCLLTSRLEKIVALIVTSIVLSTATLCFQTITNNKILSPSILGLDSIFILINTLVVFSFSLLNLNRSFTLYLNLLIMIIVCFSIYLPLLNNKYLMNKILIIGVILSSLLNSINTFLSVIMDPNDYLIVQSKTMASFNNINYSMLVSVMIISLMIIIIILKKNKTLDVMSLGQDYATNLGVNVKKETKIIFALIIILISLITALIGPLTFLGFMSVSIAYQLTKSYKHIYLIIVSSLVAILISVGSLFIIERVLNYGALVGPIINLVGGLYFIYILLKGANK